MSDIVKTRRTWIDLPEDAVTELDRLGLPVGRQAKDIIAELVLDYLGTNPDTPLVRLERKIEDLRDELDMRLSVMDGRVSRRLNAFKNKYLTPSSKE